MKISAYRQPEKVVIEGHFYCGFDLTTRQIQLAVEAASVEEAQQRMAAVAHLIGITKVGELFFVVLEEAPHGVPTFLKGFFSVPKVARSQGACTSVNLQR